MGIIDYIYPRRCPICMDVMPPGDALICTPCIKKIRRVEEPKCYKCGGPLKSEEEELCGRCTKNMPGFEKGIAWADYSSKYIRRLMSQIKYHDGRSLLDYPCKEMGLNYKDTVDGWNAQVLIPVPVHKSRLKKRGYNQAEEICKRLGKIWKLPVDTELLLRTEKTRAQKELNVNQRKQNLYHAFSVSEHGKQYDTVILVDDIYTTGSTVAACTKRLMEHGIKHVYVAVTAIGRGIL